MDKKQANMRKVVSLGFMSGTAMASPMLAAFPSIWLFDIAVFFLASVIFLSHFHQEMMKYGSISIVLAILLGLAAYSAARTPLGELAPWLPVSSSLFVLLTVYALPEFHKMIRHMEAPDLEHGHLLDIPLEAVNPQYQNQGSQPLEGLTPQRMLDIQRDIANMNHEIFPGLADLQSSHGSDIVLVDDHMKIADIALHRLMHVRLAGYPTNELRSITPSETYDLELLPTSGSSAQSSQVCEAMSRSESPTSEDANMSSSASIEEQRPLLE